VENIRKRRLEKKGTASADFQKQNRKEQKGWKMDKIKINFLSMGFELIN